METIKTKLERVKTLLKRDDAGDNDNAIGLIQQILHSFDVGPGSIGCIVPGTEMIMKATHCTVVDLLNKKITEREHDAINADRHANVYREDCAKLIGDNQVLAFKHARHKEVIKNLTQSIESLITDYAKEEPPF